jgi:N utilization substance protein A
VVGQPGQFVINAMAPAEVQSIIVDEEKHSMDLAVAEDRLAQAIGKWWPERAPASRLSGWQLNVMTRDRSPRSPKAEQATRAPAVHGQAGSRRGNRQHPGVRLQHRRGNRLRPVGELLAVEGFDEDIVEELRSRARDALLQQALAAEEQIDEHQPATDLLELEGMDEELAFTCLARRGHPR